MSAANNSSLIVDQLVTYADWFFPGEIDFDRDLEIGIINGSDNSGVGGLRRCVSSGSLSDVGESPPQGSPKPATRRKNKPAPTPPNCTPDKNEKKNIEDKPPPAPDKPPRPLTTATLNRHTYKSQKHEFNTELTAPHQHHDYQQLNHEIENKLDKKINESDFKPLGFDALTSTDLFITENNEKPLEQQEVIHDIPKVDHEIDRQRKDSDGNRPIGFESINIASVSSKISDNDNDVHKSKPILAEKPSTLERRKIPVAAPRTTIVQNTGTN